MNATPRIRSLVVPAIAVAVTAAGALLPASSAAAAEATPAAVENVADHPVKMSNVPEVFAQLEESSCAALTFTPGAHLASWCAIP